MDTTALASEATLSKTIDALTANGFKALSVATKAEALAKVKELIPAGASVYNGSSTTLDQIGLVDYLKTGEHGWNNKHEGVLAETDPGKQAILRKQAVISDFYLGSVHAVTETGEAVIASASGSQLPSIVFTSQNIIFVVGTQKIVPTLDAAITRVREHVYPLEDARMKSVGMGGSVIAKMLILEKEPAFMGRTVQFVFVQEELGF